LMTGYSFIPLAFFFPFFYLSEWTDDVAVPKIQ
jgi:hypothetical protein